jgi:hypothetical protein
VQRPLNFPKEVFGIDRSSTGRSMMRRLTERYAKALARHRDDLVLPPRS